MRGRKRPDAEAVRRAEESIRAIEAGGIPIAATERLTKLREGGTNFFTSDLTTNEFLLIRQAGFRPVTQVMGSCFYNVGWQNIPMGGWGYSAGGTFELEVQSEAWNEARRLAFSRLEQEAKLAGADAVLGVRITRGAYDWAQGLIEFAAVGTAVVSEGFEFGDEIFLSSLSGQQFASLVRSGWMPIGITAGSTVSYVMGGIQTMRAITGAVGVRAGLTGMRNQELTELTRGVYAARQLTMRHVERQARALEAAGIVGMKIEQHQHAREIDQQGYKRLDLIVTMHAIGTAVAQIDEPAEPPPTYIALRLNEESR
jgi:uncharacterized protein YbjQ (UPF0145 family)